MTIKKTHLWGVLLALVGVIVVALLIFGRRYPTQEERLNRRALDSILTAITMKNFRLLEESAKQAKARHEAGQLTDEQYRCMEAFINKARAGDWASAEMDGYEFRKQHPFVKEGQ
jgi:hypothetical protein